ncbi:MAG TPA: hypothetical protein VIH97_02420, partial [Candidatus Acidoferrales bacterium]
MPPTLSAEGERLQASRQRAVHWKRWGPYLSERQWGTVREDYSANGDAWNYFPHDHARSRAYRWGEDGIAGFSDRHQHICFALALWNEKDPILKERLFGLSNREGNHGEDVKEYYYYLDATPTSSYLKYLYKYPQGEFPYGPLVVENAKRTRKDPEYELIDTGIFKENRYFDIFVEYAKADFEDILIRITAWNRGPDPARLHLLPTLWFRNRWDWGDEYDRPEVTNIDSIAGTKLFQLSEFHYGKRWLLIEGSPETLFTENETNMERLFNSKSPTPFVKDAFHRYVVNGERTAVNPELAGTKASAYFASEIAPGKSWAVRLRLTNQDLTADNSGALKLFGPAFEQVFDQRIKEADEFYAKRIDPKQSEDARNVQRQAFAGLLWCKQSY